VADCLIARASLGTFLTTARSIAEMASASLLEVLWRAWKVRFQHSAAFKWPPDLRFLSNDARAMAVNAQRHPWLDPPPGALPGKAAHIAMVAAAQSVAEGFDVEDHLPTYSPLIAQPLIEACIAAPSWLWFEEGRNRALARHAFAPMLPADTTKRRSKGAPDGFIAQLFESRVKQIRRMLLDGRLRSEGVLDGTAIEVALAAPSLVRGNDYLRIMKLVDAEAWSLYRP
jgi:asparagine synthase (glutamine-hydrolysing)